MKSKPSAGDSRVNNGMAPTSTAPRSLLTTSRRLIEQLEIFKKEAVQHKDHKASRYLSNDFAVIEQAMLDVKNSQDKAINGLEGPEPVSLLSHQLPNEFLVEAPPKTCYRIVPAQPAETVDLPNVNTDGKHLYPRDPDSLSNLKAARDHLLWKHTPTQLISVFDSKQRALAWAAMLQAEHSEDEFVLLEIDTSSLQSRFLYDATKLAKYLDIPGFRINYHHGEYLWLGAIERRYITRTQTIARERGLEQIIDAEMAGSFALMNQETTKYALDASGRGRSQKISRQKLGNPQAPMASGSDNGRDDTMVEKIGPHASYGYLKLGANELQHPLSTRMVSTPAQRSTKRRWSAQEDLSVEPEAPKKAKTQDKIQSKGKDKPRDNAQGRVHGQMKNKVQGKVSGKVHESEQEVKDRRARQEEADLRRYQAYYDRMIVGGDDASVNYHLDKSSGAPVGALDRAALRIAYRGMWGVE